MNVRVFHDTPVTGTTIELDEEESHYLVRVRRARPGDSVDVLDGTAVFEATVVAIDPRCATLKVHKRHVPPVVPPIELGLGLPDPKATLESITLTCEIGVASIALVRCANSHHATPSPDRVDRVVKAAQRQCGRPRAPAVQPPISLVDWLARSDSRPAFVATPTDEWEPGPLPADVGLPDGARVLVGPEGGLTASEVEAAWAAGLRPLSLGPWILRSPTAAALAVGRLLHVG